MSQNFLTVAAVVWRILKALFLVLVVVPATMLGAFVAILIVLGVGGPEVWFRDHYQWIAAHVALGPAPEAGHILVKECPLTAADETAEPHPAPPVPVVPCVEPEPISRSIDELASEAAGIARMLYWIVVAVTGALYLFLHGWVIWQDRRPVDRWRAGDL